jgi:hypothetical protein
METAMSDVYGFGAGETGVDAGFLGRIAMSHLCWLQRILRSPWCDKLSLRFQKKLNKPLFSSGLTLPSKFLNTFNTENFV